MLYCALEKLDLSERSIVERFYFVKDTLNEIACDSSQSYNNLLRAKSKALKKLRNSFRVLLIYMEEERGFEILGKIILLKDCFICLRS
ncbi:hypothetical protein [Clostridium estertheticum]|uniref:hypothetical protein n=1 Tax=Clostridium estertheticum TaxID=238834 RepID=UPI001C0C6C0C|nr:hypothetical protein [Clostridium estertheticum]MBU3217336.1 hypothetical protein [Clostridium estertheticum]